MTLRRSILLTAAALAVAATAVPVAGAGPGDVQTIRAVAVRYTQATENGDPVACQLLTPNGQAILVYLASKFTKKTLSSCTTAVAALAKLNASQFASPAAAATAHAAELRALAKGKVTVRGAKATLNYTENGVISVSSSMDFALVQGHWLIDL